MFCIKDHFITLQRYLLKQAGLFIYKLDQLKDTKWAVTVSYENMGHF